MKNTIRIDHEHRQLVMDRTFAKRSENIRNEEYAILQSVRQDYPEYQVLLRRIKRSKTKECYRGLNYEYMEDFIKTHGSEEECEKNLAEFKEQKLISLCHSTSRRYPTIKKWFLAKYPEVIEFGIPDAAEENSSAEDNELAYEMPVKISA